MEVLSGMNLEGLGKVRELSVRMIGVPTEIRTEDTRNVSESVTAPPSCSVVVRTYRNGRCDRTLC
jgi:hypothetical protein